jgi:hypothetical protein
MYCCDSLATKKLIGWHFHPLWAFRLKFFEAKLRCLCLQTHKTFRIFTRTAATHTLNCRFALASQRASWNSSCFIYKWKNLNLTFDVFILRLSAAICTHELTKLMTSTAVLPYFIHEANTKSSLHITRISSSYGNSFIGRGLNFNWAQSLDLWRPFFGQDSSDLSNNRVTACYSESLSATEL